MYCSLHLSLYLCTRISFIWLASSIKSFISFNDESTPLGAVVHCQWCWPVLPAPVAMVLGPWSLVFAPCIGQLLGQAPGGTSSSMQPSVNEQNITLNCRKYASELQMKWSPARPPWGWNIIPDYAYFNRMQNNVFNLCPPCRLTQLLTAD